MSITNQKHLEVVKGPPIPPFVSLEHKQWMEACQTLTKTELIIYLYLIENANGFVVDFSPQHIANLGLMSRESAVKARRGLERKGFIVNDKIYADGPQLRAAKQKIQNEIKEKI